MRRKIGTVLVMLGAILILCAIALLAYNRRDDWRAGQSVAEIQDKLEDEKEADNSFPSVTADTDAEDSEMPTIEIDGYEYIGTLSIPSYGLELPIMSEWSYAGLKIAPGRYQGSVLTDDLIICGHNYERHFGNLKNLEPGDEISFTDVRGKEYQYEVQEVTILQPTDVEEMVSRESGEWDLTLFTCTLGGQTRVTVRCSRIE